MGISGSKQTKPPFIAVSGSIAAGKTTLCESIANKLSLPLYKEPHTQNPYLEKFYKDPSTYAFRVQMFFLSERLKHHEEIISNGKGGVQDRTMYEGRVFAKVLAEDKCMDETDLETYESIFRITTQARCLTMPDIFIYLKVPPETCLERIKKRGRSYEKDITLDYLKKLHKQYENFIDEISQVCPVLRVDWTKFGSTDSIIEEIQGAFYYKKLMGPITGIADFLPEEEEII